MLDFNSSPVPVVFCITELNPGGAERALVQIVSRLPWDKWRPTVICLGPSGPMADELTDVGIEVVCLGARKWWDFPVFFRLIKELKRLRPQIVQTFLFHANIFGRIAARFAKVPIVLSGIRVAEKRSSHYLKIDRWTDSCVNYHVCVSNAVRDYSQEVGKLPEEKLVVIPNGVDLSRFQNAVPADRSQFHLQPDEMITLFVGRLDPQKGVSDLIAAAAQLQEENVPLKWILVGDGPEREKLRQQVIDLQLEGSVIFLGFREDVPELLKMADLFVFPSLWEGMPNAILEAIASQIPIVTTEVEGVSELLQAGRSAEIVPAQSPKELAIAVKKLVESPELRAQYAATAAKNMTDEYSWETVTGKYEQLFESLLQAGNLASSK